LYGVGGEGHLYLLSLAYFSSGITITCIHTTRYFFATTLEINVFFLCAAVQCYIFNIVYEFFFSTQILLEVSLYLPVPGKGAPKMHLLVIYDVLRQVGCYILLVLFHFQRATVKQAC
jgi:hypothetical protein